MLFREKFKTYKNVFDFFTENTLFRLISKGYFEGLESPISIGKESNVFSGLKKGGSRVVVKIYRLSTCDFKKMHDYMRYDPRFPFLKKNRRTVIFAWAQREYRNLLKAREGGVRVPTPIAVLNNVLIMEFVGNDNPAPKLKDQKPKNLKKFFDEIAVQMKKLHKAGVIHGDLSPYNILNDNEKPVLIDISQGTILDNPRAEEYLQRDVRTVCNYFRNNGLKLNDDEVLRFVASDIT